MIFFVSDSKSIRAAGRLRDGAGKIKSGYCLWDAVLHSRTAGTSSQKIIRMSYQSLDSQRRANMFALIG